MNIRCTMLCTNTQRLTKRPDARDHQKSYVYVYVANADIPSIWVGGLIIGPPTPNHKNGPWFCFPPVLIIGFI